MTHRHLIRMAALAGSALIAIVPLHAQEGAAPAESANEIIVTAQQGNQTQVSRSGGVGVLGDKPASDVPFNVKSYNSALILNQQPQTLGQVLENDPSIRTSLGFGNAAEVFIIRGFPLFGEDVGLEGLYGITPRQLVAPELYDQVQVLNGASAFLNGAAPSGTGLGGSVNLTLKHAEDKPLTRLTANYSGTGHFGGSVDMGRRFGEAEAFGVRINAAYRAGDISVDDEYHSSAVIGAGFDYRGEKLRLSLDVAYQRFKVRNLRSKVTLGFGVTAIPDVPSADANYNQPWSYSTLRDVFGISRAEYDLADNAMLYASFGARDGSEQGIYDGITLTDVTTGAATGSGLYVPRTDNNEAATAGLRVKLAGGGISHEINIGGSQIWQVNRNGYDFLYPGPGFTPYATNLYNTPTVPLPGSVFVGGDLDDPFAVSRTRLGSVFASDTLGFWDDRILLTAGLRLQTMNLKSYSYGDGSLVTEYDENAVTPVVGLVIKPVEGLSLYANRIQGLAQGPTAPLAVGTAPVSNGGDVFAPYKTTQYELGGKLGFGRFNAAVAVYQTQQPSTGSVPDTAIPGNVVFGIFGKQRNRGVEFSLDGEPVDGLRLIAGASFTQAKQRDMIDASLNGLKAKGVPDYTVNANVEWDLPFLPAATLTGRVVNTGKQMVDAANTLELKGWTRFDLGARYVALVGDHPLTLRFNVDNVANKRYWASAYDSFSNALLQGGPRTFKLSASIDM
ncbi:TonB-dependent receptor [Sphingobium boeckii]|uniref:Iron complex outermembrane receptor protein n=1 Tax=Sphingobium boeckii TaxID=1082345 RepID=A0A7W9AJE8_9SPHN|nr:TonB-dependent receptor [Sphingobium boeckii]MBB5686561.1 iron complex outermembrane receptor protein [Sphingobium boeckii]